MQNSRLFWGILLIIFGFALLADNIFGLSAWDMIWRFAPVLIVVFAVWTYIKQPKSIAFSLIVGLFGILLLLRNFDVINVNIFSLWPLALIGIGFMILFRGINARVRKEKIESFTDTTIFAGSKKVINSDVLNTVNLYTLFGSSELDLSDCDLSGTVEIETTVVFGEIKLKLPKNVVVANEVMAVLGEVKNKAEAGDNVKKGSSQKATVLVKGAAVFGSVELSK